MAVRLRPVAGHVTGFFDKVYQLAADMDRAGYIFTGVGPQARVADGHQALCCAAQI